MSKQPKGWKLEAQNVNVKGTGFAYQVEVMLPQSIDAAVAFFESIGGGAETVLGLITDLLTRQALATAGRSTVTEAVKASSDPENDSRVREAVQAVRDVLVTTLPTIGRRGGGRRHESGFTRVQRETIGTAAAVFFAENGRWPNAEEMAELAALLA